MKASSEWSIHSLQDWIEMCQKSRSPFGLGFWCKDVKKLLLTCRFHAKQPRAITIRRTLMGDESVQQIDPVAFGIPSLIRVDANGVKLALSCHDAVILIDWLPASDFFPTRGLHIFPP